MDEPSPPDEPVAPTEPKKKTTKPRKPPADIKSLGATYALEHVERQVKIYPIQESELWTMSVLNTLSTFMFTLGGIFLSVTLSIWTGILVDGGKAAGTGQAVKMEWACFVIAAIFWIVGIWAIIVKRNEIHRIKAESSELRLP